MTTLIQHHKGVFGALAAVGISLGSAVAADKSLTEFEVQDNGSLNWRVVNDGVMGGLSKGRMSLTKDGILNFEGRLSLENNGGFSSIRTGDLNLDLSDYSGVSLRVKGDGRTYQMRLGSDAHFRGMEVSFKAEFPTVKGKWQVVRIPFADFTGSFRGRTLEDEVLNTSVIRRLGLLLADKKAGPFGLQVDWIHAYSGAESSANVLSPALADVR